MTLEDLGSWTSKAAVPYNINPQTVVNDVEVYLSMTHSYLGDLEVWTQNSEGDVSVCEAGGMTQGALTARSCAPAQCSPHPLRSASLRPHGY